MKQFIAFLTILCLFSTESLFAQIKTKSKTAPSAELKNLAIYGMDANGIEYRYYKNSIQKTKDGNYVVKTAQAPLPDFLKAKQIEESKGRKDSVEYLKYRYSIVWQEINCTTHKFKLTRITDYNENDQVLFQTSAPDDQWRDIDSDSPEKKLESIVCTTKKRKK